MITKTDDKDFSLITLEFGCSMDEESRCIIPEFGFRLNGMLRLSFEQTGIFLNDLENVIFSTLGKKTLGSIANEITAYFLKRSHEKKMIMVFPDPEENRKILFRLKYGFYQHYDYDLGFGYDGSDEYLVILQKYLNVDNLSAFSAEIRNMLDKMIKKADELYSAKPEEKEGQ